MVKRDLKSCVCLTSIVGTALILLVVTSLPSPTQAAPLALAPHSTPVLPPRPTRRSTPAVHSSSRDSRPESSIGGYIELRIESPQVGLWTIVQWQDGLGNWHNVEGWQGTLDEGNKKVWSVALADFGKGPFRWAVYRGQGGELLAESEIFYLPDSADKTVTVRLIEFYDN